MMNGFLGGRHLISLAVFAAFFLVLFAVLRRCPPRAGRAVLAVLSFAGIPAIVWYPLAYGELLRFLPLELCSFTALLLPVAVLTGNRALNNILLLWSVGSFCAILLNPLETAWAPAETEFWMFYAPHAVEAAVPWLSLALGRFRRDPRYIPAAVVSTAAAYTFSHLCNRMINGHYARIGSAARVNYMFAEFPENPVLDACWRVIPAPYWYGFVLVPFVLLLLMLIDLPEIVRKIQGRR